MTIYNTTNYTNTNDRANDVRYNNMVRVLGYV